MRLHLWQLALRDLINPEPWEELVCDWICGELSETQALVQLSQLIPVERRRVMCHRDYRREA